MRGNSDTERDLIKWIREAGGFVHEALDLFHSTNRASDRGVFARADIRKGEQLLLIPSSLTLHFSSSREYCGQDGNSSNRVMDVLENTEGLTPFLTSLLLLIAEMTLGKDSHFFPYCQTLPKEAPLSLITWSGEDLTMLQGTSLERNQDFSFFSELFNSQIQPLMAKYPDLWSPEYMSFKFVLSLAAIVQSRVFHLKQENWITNKVDEGSTLYLLPGIDMLNHASDIDSANTELLKLQDQMTVELDNGQSIVVDGYFTMKAEQDISKGQEILHSYGDLSDAALLRIYGFVSTSETRNMNNFLELKYKVLRQACFAVLDQQEWLVSDINSREAFLKAHMLPHLEETEFHLMQHELLSDHFLTIFQVLLLPDDEFQELQEDYSEAKENDFLLGDQFIDDTDWTQMVILALLEVVKIQETELASMSVDVTSTEKKALADTIRRGEQYLLNDLKNVILTLSEFSSDEEMTEI